MAGRIVSVVMGRSEWDEKPRTSWDSAASPTTNIQVSIFTHLWPLRNIQPSLHRRPRQTALQPPRHVLERIERDEIARAVEADQVTYPTETRDMRGRVFIGHHTLPRP